MTFLRLTILAAFATASLVRAGLAQELTATEDAALRAAVAQVAASVVRIETIGGQERVGEFRTGATATTGLAVDKDGFILSSAFAFVQKPTAILVRHSDGSTQPAEIIARDRSRMLVLLKIADGSKLTVPEFVPRDEVRVGQWAVAVGRTFSVDQTNVSAGIISAVDRIWGRAIQTDANVSPANYGGPLVDIRGRVYGVLVPLSPDHQHEMAGTEWYDSGIGFAVPLQDVLAHFDQLKSGEDLYAGLLGITLKGRNIYADPAIVATCATNSPAAKAGLLVGDEIVEIAGKIINRQSELKHALGPLYAGDAVEIVVARGGDEIKLKPVLAATIEAFEHPFLGILPLRTKSDEAGVKVRYVYPGSPAAKAEIASGDILVSLDGQPLTTRQAWQDTIAVRQPGEQVVVQFRRDGGDVKDANIVLDRLPASIPESPLPSPYGNPPPAPSAAPALQTLKVPELPNVAMALAPTETTQQANPGVVIVLGNPGKIDADRFRKEFESFVQNYNLLVVAPQSEDSQRWEPTELEFMRKILDQVIKDYDVDRSRIAVFGYQSGGALSYRFAMAHRDVVRAVAVVDSAFPPGIEVRANDPVDRLAFYVAYGDESPLKAEIESNIKVFRELKFPVIEHHWPGKSRELEAAERDGVARWLDTLDRI